MLSREQGCEGVVGRPAGAAPFPRGSEPVDLLVDIGWPDSARGGERRHPLDGGREVAEVAEPGGIGALGEGEKAFPGLTVDRHPPPAPRGDPLELVVEIRCDVLAAGGKAGKTERPQIDAREEIGTEPAGANGRGEIGVGARQELEVACHFGVGADR